MKEGFKVVLAEYRAEVQAEFLLSAIIELCTPFEVEYAINRESVPREGCGPLSVFSEHSLESARGFARVNFLPSLGPLQIYRCAWEPWSERLPRTAGIPWDLHLHREEYPRFLWTPNKTRSLFMYEGGRLAKMVRLIERVW